MSTPLDNVVTMRQALYDFGQSVLQHSPEDQLESELAGALEYKKNFEEAITPATYK